MKTTSETSCILNITETMDNVQLNTDITYFNFFFPAIAFLLAISYFIDTICFAMPIYYAEEN
jgi:hypothetical protein